METFLLIVLIVVVLVAAWIVITRARAKQPAGTPSRMFAATGQREGTNLMRLKLGDHVTIDGTEISLWRVNEVWRSEGDGSVWRTRGRSRPRCST